MKAIYHEAINCKFKLIRLLFNKQGGNRLELIEIQAYIKKTVDLIEAISNGKLMDYEKSLGEINDFINNSKKISIKQR